MKNIYDYDKNITINKTPNGDFVITMNEEILTMLVNYVHDSAEYQEEHNFHATSKDTMKLWDAMMTKKFTA